MEDFKKRSIAVLIPCYNEELTIEKVIKDFKRELSEAEIYVFDNNSSDRSADIAFNSGAKVISVKAQGKGNVIRAMFQKVHADYYVMVDGDDTYPAENVHDLLNPVIEEKADMTVGLRLQEYSANAFRPLHIFGNNLVRKSINLIFNKNILDPMSGYRAYNNEVVARIPIVAKGFDVETEMTTQMLYRDMVITEIPINYRERPKGSYSKLNTLKDGLKVIYKIISLFQSYKPLTFFGLLSIIIALFCFILGYSVISEFLMFSYVYSIPKAILATGLGVMSMLSLCIGLILHVMNIRLSEISTNIDKRNIV